MSETVTLVRELKRLIDNGGPSEGEFENTLAVFDEIAHHRKEYEEQILAYIENSNGAFNSTETMQGHVCKKPFGYHGDFLIIDKIYQNYVTRDASLKRWDDFFHWGTASKAVRNRKAFFKSLLEKKLGDAGNSIAILNIASGPCRDLKEFHDECGYKYNYTVHCVDSDARSIEYARDIVGLNEPHISFEIGNAFKFSSEASFDVIWSAGLFDYLDDRSFVVLLKRLSRHLTPNGEMIIGNFSHENTQRKYMEFGGWFLHHRSEDDLIKLAESAGFKGEQITVDAEETAVNLFLRIKIST